MATLAMAIIGCGVISKEVVPEGSIDSSILFQDDFRGDEIGALPTEWTVNPRATTKIEVVENTGMVSGKALRFEEVNEGSGASSVNAYFRNPPAGTANVIEVEYSVLWIKGSAVNINVSLDNKTAINWFINDGVLGYRTTVGGSTTSGTLGSLGDGWNRVRAVANLEKEEIDFYLNDMDTPLAEGIGFRDSIDTWEGARFLISHTRISDTELLYGDVRIRALE